MSLGDHAKLPFALGIEYINGYVFIIRYVFPKYLGIRMCLSLTRVADDFLRNVHEK